MSQVHGGTRWKRFAVVMVPSVAATAAIGVGLAQGALAASFAVSGQEFKVRAGHLEGTGFAQYGGMDMGYKNVAGGEEMTAHPVAISSFQNAKINDMCQSVVTKVPGFGNVTLRLTAGTDKNNPVVAKDLYLDVSELDGDATFEDIEIGVAAKNTDKDVKGGMGPDVKDKILENGFGQQARVAKLDGVKQKAWATTAASFKLSDLSMRLYTDAGHECY
ncbi:DUF6230 family protein [Streptomyces sp. NPDC127084]|uniref:DUF6230 family protein n=1 Tax=Streptomyces sp. NPDC127084 TaxID=3347133 RepID=UPI00366015FA